MLTPVFWIPTPAPGRVGIMARPRGHDWLEDEIAGLARQDVSALISLLTPAEQHELGLTEEGAICARQQIAYLSLPIGDRQTQRSTRPPLILCSSWQGGWRRAKL